MLDQHLMRYVLLGFCVLSMTACTGSPTGPTTSLDTEFTLAPADVMKIDGTSLAFASMEYPAIHDVRGRTLHPRWKRGSSDHRPIEWINAEAMSCAPVT